MRKKEDFCCVIFGCGDYYNKMFVGINNIPNIQYCFNRLNKMIESNLLLKMLYRFSSSRLVRNNVLNKRISEFWFKFEFESKRVYGRKILFIFFQNNTFSHNTLFLNYIKKLYPYGKLIFWLTNTLETCKEDINFLKNNYDEIVTFSRNDSEKYGLLFHEWCYSAVPADETILSDVFFCGRDKGRKLLVEKVYSYLTSQGLICDFTILTNEETKNGIKGIYYTNRFIPYDEVFEKMKCTKCILEVMPGKQDNAPTLRWAEAIALSKKLLTNNIEMKQNLLGNDQLFVFSSPETIDIEWIRNTSGDTFADPYSISPNNFISDLEKLVWKQSE